MDREKLNHFTVNPSSTYSDGARYSDEILPGGLLDIELARQWFARIDQVREAGLYTYGIPLASPAMAKSGYGDLTLLLFSTYGYLGLNKHPRIIDRAIEATERWGTTTGGARLLTGTMALHLETERELAAYLGVAATALFASGYDANLAAISSLLGRHDVAIIDEKAHRSILDGCRLSGCRVMRFPHNDVDRLETMLIRHTGRGARVLVAVDGVYSMDGNLAPLDTIVTLKDKYGAFLLLDESHAVGVIGEAGRGTPSATGVDPTTVDIVTGSLGKAFPSGGGFVGGSRGLISFLQHGSAPYMFSSALTPANTAAIHETLRVVVEEPEHLQRLRDNSGRLMTVVENLGLQCGSTETPIVPVLLGDAVRAYTWARWLLDDGIYVSAIPTPAVPAGQSRLRLCATAQHTPQDFERLAAALQKSLERDRLPESKTPAQGSRKRHPLGRPPG